MKMSPIRLKPEGKNAHFSYAERKKRKKQPKQNKKPHNDSIKCGT